MPEVKDQFYTMRGGVVFELSGKQFCADIRDVYGFLDVSNIPQINKTVLTKKEYLNCFNRQFPFINIHQIFKLNQNAFTDCARIIFIEHNSAKFCFLSDRIVEFIVFDEKINPQRIYTNNENYLPADFLQYENRTFLVPHFTKIIRLWNKSLHPKINIAKRRKAMPVKKNLPP